MNRLVGIHLLNALALILCTQLRAGDVKDVTDKIEKLGSPMKMAYGDKAKEKEGTSDLQLFDGKIYYGHGTMNNKIPCKLIYYDLKKKEFEIERSGGKPILVYEELLSPLRVMDGDLFMGSLDPNGGGTHYIRKSERGKWINRKIAKDAHNRDVFNGSSIVFALNSADLSLMGFTSSQSVATKKDRQFACIRTNRCDIDCHVRGHMQNQRRTISSTPSSNQLPRGRPSQTQDHRQSLQMQRRRDCRDPPGS